MTKFVSTFLFAAATIAAPALAAPAVSPIAFQRAGIHYVGTVADRADGSRVITGREVETGHVFELTVANGMVNGLYDHQPVSYEAPRVAPAKPSSSAVAVASNSGM